MADEEEERERTLNLALEAAGAFEAKRQILSNTSHGLGHSHARAATHPLAAVLQSILAGHSESAILAEHTATAILASRNPIP